MFKTFSQLFRSRARHKPSLVKLTDGHNAPADNHLSPLNYQHHPLLMALEPRIMLDGAAVATALEAGESPDQAPRPSPAEQVTQNSEPFFQAQAPAANPLSHDESLGVASASSDIPSPNQLFLSDTERLFADTETTDNNNPANASLNESEYEFGPTDSESAPEQTTRQEIVFVDAAVADYKQFLSGLNTSEPIDYQVHILERGIDGIEEITNVLGEVTGIDAVHLISHGNPDSLNLGASRLSNDNLEHYQSSLRQWSDSLNNDADILIYGCDLASTTAGQQLIQSIADLTQADIAASNDDTGTANLGGNWDLEYQTAQIESSLAVSEDFQANWGSVLATTYIQQDVRDNTYSTGSNGTVGQSFQYDSGTGSYEVSELQVFLRRAGGAGQTVKVSLLDGWGGAELGSNTLDESSLSSSFDFYSFAFSPVTLTDNVTYYIKVDGTGSGNFNTGTNSTDVYAAGTLINDAGNSVAGEDLTFRVALSDHTDLLIQQDIQDDKYSVSSGNQVGQTFQYTSGTGSYAVDELQIYLRRDGIAAQNVKVSLLDSWNGTVLGSDTKLELAVGNSYAFHSFNFPSVTLIDGTTYFIKVEGVGLGDVDVGGAGDNQYAGGTRLDLAGAAVTGEELTFRVVGAAAANNDPSGTGNLLTTTLNDNFGATNLFSNLSITDSDTGENDLQLEIVLSDPTAGIISGGGFTETSAGRYTTAASLTVAEANTALDNTQFIATNNSGDSGTLNTDISVAINDQGGSGYQPVLAPTAVTINQINDNPSVDLDGSAAGNDYTVTFSEDDGPTPLADTDSVVADVDSSNLAHVSLAISGLLDGDDEIFVLDGTSFTLATNTASQNTTSLYTVAIATGAGTANVTITKQGSGNFTDAEVETLIEAMSYQHTNTSNPADGNRLFDISVNDGIAEGSTARTTVNVNPINDAPTVNLDADNSSLAGGNHYRFSFTQGDGATRIADSDTEVADAETGTTFANVTLAVSNLKDADNETLILDGSTLPLATDATLTTAGATYNITLTTAADTASMIITRAAGGNFSETEAETLIKALEYQHIDGVTPTDGNRLVEITVNDGISDSVAAVSTIDVDPLPPTPTLNLDSDNSSLAGGFNYRFTYTEGDPATSVADSDADVNSQEQITSASVTITGLLDGNAEAIELDGSSFALATSATDVDTTSYRVNVTPGAGSADLTISKVGGVGTFSTGETQSLIQAINYQHTDSDDPTNGDRLVAIYITNTSAVDSATAQSTINIDPVNDSPTVNLDSNNSAGAGGNDYQLTFTEDDAPLAITDTDTAVGDADSNSFTSVNVSLSGLQDGDSEELSLDGTTFPLATTASNIDTGGGMYTVDVTTAAGSASVVITRFGGGTFTTIETQDLLEAVRYQHTDADSPTSGDRLLDITVSDGTTSSLPARSTIAVNDANDNPSGSGILGAGALDDNAGPVDLFSGLTVIDSDPTEMDLQLRITLSNASAGTISGGGFGDLGGGAYETANDLTQAEADAALDAVQFSPAENTAPSGTIATNITVEINDQGGGGYQTVLGATPLTVNLINDGPELNLDSDNSSAAGGNDYFAAFSPGSTPIAIADSESSVTDADMNSTFPSVRLVVSGLADGNAETLSLDGTTFLLATPVTTVNTAGGNYTVTLTSGAGTADLFITRQGGGSFSTAQTEVLVETIRYGHTNTINPTLGNRTIDFTVNDGLADSGAARSTIGVDANTPILSLDKNGSSGAGSNNFQLTFNEGDSATSIADTDTSVLSTDPLTQVRLEISGLRDGNAETLRLDGTSFSLATPATAQTTSGGNYDATLSTGGGSAILTITKAGGGSHTALQTEQLIKAIEYRHTDSDSPTNGNRSIGITVSSATNTSALAVSTINVNPVNDRPSGFGNLSATSLAKGAGPTQLFSDLSVIDNDAGENDLALQVTLSDPLAGTLSGGGFTAVGGGVYQTAASLSEAEANSALDNLTFTPAGSAGATQITVKVDDQGGAGLQTVMPATTLTITSAGEIPTLDLDSNNSSGSAGNHYQLVYTEGDAARPIADTDAMVTASSGVAQFTLSVSGILDNTAEALQLDGSTIQLSTTVSNQLTSGEHYRYSVTPAADAATIVLSKTSGDDLTATEATELLTSIRYLHTNTDNPSTGDRLISTVISNDSGASEAANTLISVIATNNPPTLDLDGNDSSGNVSNGYQQTFSAGDPAVAIADTDVLITDTDSNDINAVNLAISGVANGNAERIIIDGSQFALATPVSNAVTAGGQFQVSLAAQADGASLVISKAGGGEFSHGEAGVLISALRYERTDDSNLSAGVRSISVTVSDGGSESAPAISIVSVIPAIDSPLLSGGLTASRLNDNVGAYALFSALTVADAGSEENDLQLGITLTNPEVGAISGGGFTHLGDGVYRTPAGLTSNEASSILASVRFTPANNTGSSGSMETLVRVQVDNQQTGLRSDLVSNLAIDRINDAPALSIDADNSGSNGVGNSGNNSVSSYTAVFNEGDNALAIADADTLISDADSGDSITRISISINQLQDGNDETIAVDGSQFGLATPVTADVTQGGNFVVSVSASDTTATLQISRASGGKFSTTEAEALISSVRYQNTRDDNPTEGDRVIRLAVSDGSSDSNPASSIITVRAVANPPTDQTSSRASNSSALVSIAESADAESAAEIATDTGFDTGTEFTTNISDGLAITDVFTESNALVNPTTIAAGQTNLVASLNGDTSGTTLSVTEQQASLRELGSESIVASYKNAISPGAQKISELLDDVLDGQPLTQGDMLRILQDNNLSNDTIRANLIAFNVVQKEARSNLYSGALSELLSDSGHNALPGNNALLQLDGLAEDKWREISRVDFPEIKQTNVAILIGIDQYKAPIPSLNTPVADITAVNSVLSNAGYQTIAAVNPTYQEIIQLLQSVGSQLSENNNLIIYFAGHGYLKEDTNIGYWLASDAETNSAGKWISTKDVADFLATLKARQIMMVADSCFSGSLTREYQLSADSAGLTADEIFNRRSVMVMSSGGEEPVMDGGGDGHSVFARNFIASLKALVNTKTGFELFSDIRNEVTKISPQIPQYGGILSAGHEPGGDYLFNKTGRFNQTGPVIESGLFIQSEQVNQLGTADNSEVKRQQGLTQ